MGIETCYVAYAKEVILPVASGVGAGWGLKLVLAVHDSEIIVKLLEKRNEDTYLIALKMRPPLKVNEDTRILGVVKMVMRRP